MGHRSTFLLAVGLACACASAPAPEPPAPAPVAIEVGPEDTPPIYFEKVLIRLPAGTVYGHVYDKKRRGRPIQDLVHTSKHMETEEFNVLMADRLIELGYDAVDPTDAVFTPDSTIRTRFRIVGVVTQLQIDTYRDFWNRERSHQTAELEMEVRLYDAAAKDVVYARSFRGAARDDGATPVALPKAVVGAIDGALADADFVARILEEHTPRASDLGPLPLPSCPAAAARLPERIGDVSKAVVTIRQGTLLGSGVLISPEGHVLTAAHVVSSDDLTRVAIGGVVELEAEVKRIDRALDVALLKIPGTGYHCLPLHSGEPVRAGTDLFAIGAPLDDRLAGSVTRGIVSGRPTLDGRELLQTDASVNLGNSGGPVLDRDGHVLGVVSSKYLGVGVEGVAFAVPTEVIRSMLGLEVTTPAR